MVTAERSLLWLLGQYRRPVVLVIVVVLASAVVDNLAIAALFPLLTVLLGTDSATAGGPILSALVSTVLVVAPEQRLLAALTLYLLILPVNVGLKFLREWAQARMSAGVTYDVKLRVLRRLIAAPYPYFFESRQGDLSYRLSVAPQNLALALLTAAIFASMALTSLGTIVLLATIDWRATIILIVVGIAFYRANRFVARRFSSGAGREKQRALSQELGLVQELITGVKEINVARSGVSWYRRFAIVGETYRRFLVRDLLSAASPGLALEFMVFAAAGVAVALLRYAVPGNVTSLLPVVAIFIYASRQLVGYAGGISRQVLRTAALGPDISLLRRALTEPDSSPEPIGKSPMPSSWTELRFDHVGFAYPSRNSPVLDDLTFTIRSGDTTAIIGPSGAGKSTILHLLLRLINPTSGHVRVDAADLADIDRDAWLKRLGYVSQELFVFDSTVADNIAFGRDVPRESIERAARTAYADEFIAQLPLGLDTIVGDRGTSLSAGQRQRIAIARALVTQPELLILDEPTSALDSHSERLVQRAMAQIARSCTLVIVAHRLATVRSADRIVVLERGRAVEVGTHEQLMGRDGPYAALHILQGNGQPVT